MPKKSRSVKHVKAADLFCGAGGTSSGLRDACAELGLKLDLVAINHWEIAIATHSANHPYAKHLCQNLDQTDPRKVVPGGRLELLWASPECMFHSNARGGRPVNDQSRMSAWQILRWAEALYIDNILVENVPEFRNWGPLGANRKPIQRLKGKIFLAFLEQLRSLGYAVDWRILNCADYGDPTTRERLFIQARRGGRPIVWPEPTHRAEGGKDMFRKYEKWRTAREILDWSDVGENIFDRKRPLSPNTLRRIFAGLAKFSGVPFVLNNRGGNDGYLRGASIREPLQAVTGHNPMQLVTPYVIGQQSKAAARSVDEPLPTVAGKGAIRLVAPFIVSLRGTHPEQLKHSVRSVDDPVPTVMGNNNLQLVTPFLIGAGGPRNKQKPRSVDKPLGAVLTENHDAIVQPYIIAMEHATQGSGDQGRAYSVERPLATLTTQPMFGPIQPFLVQYHGENRKHGERVRSIDKPAPAVATSNQFGLVQPFLIEYYGTGQARSVDRPMPSVASKPHHALVIPGLQGQALVIYMRMLKVRELARAQSFPDCYEFHGTQEEIKKQIGNAVPRLTAKALCMAVLRR